jgi:hypothetical protein
MTQPVISKYFWEFRRQSDLRSDFLELFQEKIRLTERKIRYAMKNYVFFSYFTNVVEFCLSNVGINGPRVGKVNDG